MVATESGGYTGSARAAVHNRNPCLSREPEPPAPCPAFARMAIKFMFSFVFCLVLQLSQAPAQYREILAARLPFFTVADSTSCTFPKGPHSKCCSTSDMQQPQWFWSARLATSLLLCAMSSDVLLPHAGALSTAIPALPVHLWPSPRTCQWTPLTAGACPQVAPATGACMTLCRLSPQYVGKVAHPE